MYREIRVRPVVRYLVTEYLDAGDQYRRGTTQLGEFENVSSANRLASALAYQSRLQDEAETVFEPARSLRIEVERGRGQPRPPVTYLLREVADA
jgi:hypothetical protein